jgi:16S rRNA pseudouridine516 synthase
MMNKPAGVLSATADRRQKTALDLLPPWYSRGGIAGRLDKDAEGLLLITDDGALNHALTSPRRHVTKKYLVHTDLPVPDDAAAAFEKGIDLGDFITAPALLHILSPDRKACHVSITEGKFHQIKRMFTSLGLTVTALKRIEIGPLTLDPSLSSGGFRPLNRAELSAILDSVSNLLKKCAENS